MYVHLVGQICNNYITMHRVKNVKFCSEVFNSQWSKCMENVCARLYIVIHNPSGISELDCATTKTDTAERIISIGRETLHVFFLY